MCTIPHAPSWPARGLLLGLLVSCVRERHYTPLSTLPFPFCTPARLSVPAMLGDRPSG